MTHYGGVHELVVEYLYEGYEPDIQEPAADDHTWMVHYIVRHPDDCWPENEHNECPVKLEIDNVGFDDAFGLSRWRDGRTVIEHLPEGLYEVRAWMEHYSTPEGSDWDGGLEVELKSLPPKPVRPARLELVEPNEDDES